MIPSNTVNLPVCALGAGVAHAAALALVLPLMITLPAPGESSTKLVAIPVKIVATAPASVTATPSPADLIGALMDNVGEGDADPAETVSGIADGTPAKSNDDWSNEDGADGNAAEDVAALSEDVTGALPDGSLTETAPAAEVPEADNGMESATQEEPPQEQLPQEEPVPAEVANVDTVMPPLPIRVRRDDTGEAIIQSRPAPSPPVEAAKPVVRRAPPPKRGLFGLAKPPRAPVAKAGDAAPYKGSWESLLGKPAL
ncbi:hypothetical protein AUC69_00965 [Methyloceanibacter superfactus]|uniref:Uncharacterized protein n=1 Tax=Methyloceanibacter superfactus TaxID=1774969 RepID=A0A1E3W3T6_9HYPH|nr:hypothetical protein [Methyloceanibacter superfactus]ODS00463.1 hypothetical protein AUC69_00965 [Methyloceanibacter superfactus]